ncbi:precorrin-4 C(11)-methyltransferase [uncultured Akkermansia sp.]|uniref:precorrin-4 C(11)-methyltransferase n=1 Tax=uncultured Akkermansia sp. TaxID=512294 RepID=UPI0025CEAE57|nr:precorrin-4 C(11)-methyltransferase [uncultured Akkermansia sp.]
MNTARFPIHFIGAGPGAEDLITERGAALLKEADVVVYAGSLVNPGHLKRCRPEAELHDSAKMDLEEQVEVMARGVLEGKKVVRLHTGDPSMYGAIAEQFDLLDKKGIESIVVPGVSSVFAAAAALRTELTYPGIAQSLVLTRTPGRTPMPSGEACEAFAKTGATLAFFLSAGKLDELAARLISAGKSPDTAAAVVYRATWPDEKIIRGTLSTIAGETARAGIGRQALILVGDAIGAHDCGQSLLYHGQFSHGYRNEKEDERFDGSCAFYAFTEKGVRKAQEISQSLGKAVIHSVGRAGETEGVKRVSPEDFDPLLARQWNLFDAHVFIGATGIAVRKTAPLLRDKATDPAVVCCSESGSHLIPLLSGHLGGGNRLARRLARISGGEAVITTATDTRGITAFDEAAAREKACVLNPDAIKTLNAALLDGDTVSFHGPQEIHERYWQDCPQVIPARADGAEAAEKPHVPAVYWDEEPPESAGGTAALLIQSSSFVLGIGCKKGTEPGLLQQYAEGFLARQGISRSRIKALASCTLKEQEPAILALAATWNVPFHVFEPAELDAVEIPTPSDAVFEKTGTHSVSEASAILASGGKINTPKTVCGGNVTLALATCPHGSRNKARQKGGNVIVIGLGSGSPGQLTPEAAAAMEQCTCIAGYTKYLDFIRERIHGKKMIQTGMMGEVPRCTAALEAALNGENVCMVCSGDPGILAMAGLLYEMRKENERFSPVRIEVLPGITAASISASALGAPLQNGFCLLSLSDLLVPAEEIRANLEQSAGTALPVVLYNPAGRKRRHLLEEALRIFRNQRGEKTLCAYVKHAGRPAQQKWVGTLDEFPLEDVDMSTLVLLGGPRTIRDGDVLFERRGYADKYGIS